MENNNVRILEKGYRPLNKLDISNPPTSGSGVPSVQSNRIKPVNAHFLREFKFDAIALSFSAS